MFKDDDLFSQIEMMQAYVNITEKHGPSAQLLAFIDFDGKLEEELGLEGYNAMSLQTRHEILISKFNINSLEDIALESLYEKISKFSKYSFFGMATGVNLIHAFWGDRIRKLPESTQIKTAVGVVALGLGLLTIAILNDALHKAVIPYKEFTKIKVSFAECLELDKEFYSHLPNSFDVKSWENFYNITVNEKSSFARKFEKWEYEDVKITYDKLTPLKDSGWTSELIVKELKWFAEVIDSVDKEITLQKPHVDKIREWLLANKKNPDPDVKQIVKLINKTLKYVNYSLMTASIVLPKIKRIFKVLLKRVSFEKAQIK